MTSTVEAYTPVDSALAQVLAKLKVHRAGETLPPRLAFGRVCAKDVLAPRDIPEYPTAHWDGYATNSADLRGAGAGKAVSLKVVGAAPPGERPKVPISKGEAFQVATGAGLPPGADTVVPRESAEVRGDEVTVAAPSPPGSHVYGAGEDLRKGDPIARRGRVIRAQDVGLLIATGQRKVEVWRRPKVSVLATGSELTDPDRPARGKVVNSHSPVFLRLCESLGCEPVDAGIARDDRGALTRKLRGALRGSDVVLPLGGTSVGEWEYVGGALEGLGPEVLVHGVKMDRGRVAGVSVVRGKPLVMMPGPIQGAMNAFLLIGVPIIEALSGTRDRGFEVTCTLDGTWEARRRYADFKKVAYVKVGRGPPATAGLLQAETESMKLLADADGYVVVPENVTRMEPGDRVTVRLLPGFSFA